MLLIGGWAGWPGSVLFGILLMATLTDVFDGIIARRMGIETERLRRADSLVDTVFYVFVVILVVVRYPQVIGQYWIGLLMVVILEITRAVFDQMKFGRQASYHMWSAKCWGVGLLLGFSELFLSGQAGVLFGIALGVGVITECEGLAASLILKQWRHDVPSVFHAWGVRSERSGIE